MGKLKPLRPTLREKKRYVAFKAISNNKISIDDTYKKVIEEYRFLYGQNGLSKAGAMLIKSKCSKDVGIARISHKCVDDFRTSMAMVRKINEHDTIVKSIGSSGILKKAHEKYVKGGDL